MKCSQFARILATWVVCSTPIFAAKTPIPGTEYSVELPANYTPSQPAGMPNILLQGTRADQNAYVQVTKGIAGQGGPDAAATYEALMQQVLPGLAQTSEAQQVINGRQTLVRRYFVNAGGQPVHIFAAFYADEKVGFTIHAIDTSGTAQDAIDVVTSLSSPRPTVGGLGNALAGLMKPKPAANATQLGNSGYQVVFPAGWNQMQATDTSVQYGTQDGGALIEVSWSPDESNGTAGPKMMVDMAIEEVAKGFTGNGSWTILEQQAETLPGGVAEYRLYRGTGNGRSLDVPVYVKFDNAHLLAAYGMSRTGAAPAGPALVAAIRSLQPVGQSAATIAPVEPPLPPPSTRSNLSATSPAKASSPTTSAIPPPPPPPSPARIPPPPPAPKLPAPIPPPPATPSTSAGAGYLTMVVDDSMFEFNYPAHFQRFQLIQGQSQWADPNASDPKIVMVIQTLDRGVGNTDKSVFEGILADVNNSAAAQLVSHDQITVQGIPAFRLHFTLNQHTVFKYLILDLPGPHVAALSFVGPDAQIGEIDRHYAQMIGSVHSTATAAAPSSMPAGRPPRTQANSAAILPSTSVEAWYALNALAKANDWAAVARYLVPEAAAKTLVPKAEQVCAEKGVSLAGYPGDPLARLQAMLENVPATQRVVKYLQADTLEVVQVRPENDDFHYIRIKLSPKAGHEMSFFMRRINGRWLHMPN